MEYQEEEEEEKKTPRMQNLLAIFTIKRMAYQYGYFLLLLSDLGHFSFPKTLTPIYTSPFLTPYHYVSSSHPNQIHQVGLKVMSTLCTNLWGQLIQ